jgi:hypothetical protein
MIFGHESLERGGGDVVRAAFLGAPLHKNADGHAAKHPQDPDAVITLNPAPVIVVGNIQALMQAAFDAPSLSG